jgi:hypothetical protein
LVCSAEIASNQPSSLGNYKPKQNETAPRVFVRVIL